MADRPSSDEKSTLLWLVAGNLLPLLGLGFFDWRADETLLVYWIEITATIALYSGFVLFGAREPTIDGRERGPRAIPIPGVSSRSGWIQPVGWLPPINYWNVQFVLWPLALGMLFWLPSGTIFIDLLNPDPILVRGSPVDDYIGVVSTAASVETVAVGLGVAVFQAISGGREFVSRRQYEAVSGLDMAEIPPRIGLYWLTATICTFTILILTWPFVGGFDPTTVTEARVLGCFLGLKLNLDWSLVQIRRRNEPSRLLRWLTLGWTGPTR